MCADAIDGGELRTGFSPFERIFVSVSAPAKEDLFSFEFLMDFVFLEDCCGDEELEISIVEEASGGEARWSSMRSFCRVKISSKKSSCVV